MPNFAMLSGNTVENIIVADDKHSAEKALQCTLVEITNEQPLGIGWTIIDNEWHSPEYQNTLIIDTKTIGND